MFGPGLPSGTGNTNLEGGGTEAECTKPGRHTLHENAHNVKIETNHVQMKRSINRLHCVAILVSVTGHISVFVSPTEIFRNAGSVGVYLILWLCGGILNLGICLCYVEFATMYPSAGGPYVYVLISFGRQAAFILLWGYILLICGPFWAYVSYTASLYILQPMFVDCKPPDVGVKLLAGWILLTLVALNCVYTKYVTKVQTLLSVCKILGLAFVILGGMITVIKGDMVQDNFDSSLFDTSEGPGRISLGLFYSIFTYGGWQIILGLTEEVKDPGKVIPQAVYIAFGIVIIKYLLINVAYFTLMTPAQFLSSDAVAVTFTQLLHHSTTHILSVFVGLCSVGVLNASIMGHSRSLFAGARNGQAPMILGTLHIKYMTPWTAVFVMTLWTLIMLYSGGVTTFIQFIQAFSTCMSITVIAGLLYVRYKQPDKPRPYKVSLINAVTQLLVQVILLLFALIEEPVKIGIALCIMVSGIPVYWLGVQWKSKPKSFDNFMVKMTLCLQKAMLLGKSI